ncbi:MAG: NAD-dependent dehydratase [Clostridiales bacterium]|nr:MAG: NAD-dependent dehydratase [Clostridiales bacterium]
MKILFIGGTGTISMAITKRLGELGEELYLLNRGNRSQNLPENVHSISCDISDEAAAAKALEGMTFDCVADFIAFTPDQVERDYRLFAGKTKQYIFISSASAYQTPLSDYRITEGTPLSNPLWGYSQNKIRCEELLMHYYREEGFPVTIVRPSHTYDERSVPFGVQGSKGGYQNLKRMMEGKPVIIHGDGTSLWTLTHNSDFALGFTGLIGNIHAIGEAVQITSDETLTWNQIYETVASALGVELKAVHVSSEFLDACSDEDYRGNLLGDKAASVVFDNAKLKRLVPEFTATVRFDQGVRKAIDYIKSHPECQKEDPEYDAWCDRVIAAQKAAVQMVLDAK